jgi:hypothetical protein
MSESNSLVNTELNRSHSSFLSVFHLDAHWSELARLFFAGASPISLKDLRALNLAHLAINNYNSKVRKIAHEYGKK